METGELKKITLTPQAPPAAKRRKKFPLGAVLIPLAIVLVLIGAVVIMLLPLRQVYAKAQELMPVVRETMSAAKSQDIGKTKEKLAETKTKLAEFNTEYSKILYMRSFPVAGAYVSDGQHGINAGFAAISAGQKAIDALEPNADLLGLKGKSTFVSGTAVDRMQMAVKTMGALTPKIAEMAKDVDTMRNELSQIDPNRYPEYFQGKPVRSQLKTGLAVVEETANLFVNAQPLLERLPKLLGDPKDQRYLVIFQNDKELRPTGGFITAYARFRMEKGKPILEKSDDIYSLDNALTKKYPAPREILTFHKDVYNLNIRDSNLSPDFKTSMDQFMQMYNQTTGKEPINGIIAVDTHVLVQFLKVLGPINIYDETFKKTRVFSAETDKRCDCPRAVFELEDASTKPVNFVRTDRKSIIGNLLDQIMRLALGVSPSKYWGQLFQVLVAEINQKHVLAYFIDDTTAQQAAEKFNLAGRIVGADTTAAVLKYKDGQGWDYLHINNSNMAGAKSNMFVSEKVTKDTTVNGDGTITTKLTVDYKNPYPGSDCGLESGGLCLNAPLRNWVRIYAPKGSKLTDSKGSISPKDGKVKTMDTYDSLGKTVFEGFLIVNPKGTAKLELTYTSPVKVDGQYRVLIQKQPGTDGQEWVMKLDGREKKDFTLESDTELTL
jgi:hypothetical protein